MQYTAPGSGSNSQSPLAATSAEEQCQLVSLILAWAVCAAGVCLVYERLSGPKGFTLFTLFEFVELTVCCCACGAVRALRMPVLPLLS